MDPDSIKEISKAGTEILAPPAVVQTVTTAKPIANGETKTWQDWTIEAIPAYNLKRGPAPGKLFHDKGRGNGYVLTYGGKRFYFSGDTEGVPEMRALKNIDVAFVCMNLPYTMPPDEAADAVKAFHPKVVIPYHYRGSDLDRISKRTGRDRHRGPVAGVVSEVEVPVVHYETRSAGLGRPDGRAGRPPDSRRDAGATRPSPLHNHVRPRVSLAEMNC